MIQTIKYLPRLACFVSIMVGAAVQLSAEPGYVGERVITKTNVVQLASLIAGSECVGVSVDVAGEVLWGNTAQDQLVLQTDAGLLRVKVDLHGQPAPLPGQRIRLTGQGMAGLGILDQALADNDGFHSTTEKSGTVHLTAGRHPIRAEWFNGPADFFFNVEYAGPDLVRQRIPDSVLSRWETNESGGGSWRPGLNYRCYEGNWGGLPRWQKLMPAKTGPAANFDLGVRTRDQGVALLFTGYLQVDREGDYTFWTQSDDGSRLFIGHSPLHAEFLDSRPLPEPRTIKPGQVLRPGEDYFWAVTEGVVTEIHVDPDGVLELELCAGSGRMYLVSNASDFHPPGRFSRIRATGLCRRVPAAGGGGVAGRLLVSSARQVEELVPGPASLNSPVTTLANLRRLAADGQRTGSPLCLTGTVITAASPQGFFAFQDETGGGIVQMDSDHDSIQPGQQVVLMGNGVLNGNTLLLNHAAVVNNDSVHVTTEAGATDLTAGRHAIHVSWFNRVGAANLQIYYQGPGISRRKIPNSAWVHPEIEPASGDVKWVNGLNYTCYNGDWGNVPKVAGLEPVEMGTTTNLGIQVANRTQKVGLEFSGYLDVPRDGRYFFSVFADDGSLLFIDEQMPQIRKVSPHSLPVPFPIFSRSVLGSDQDNRWSETEGTVSFVEERAGSLFLELHSIYGPMSVVVADNSDSAPLLLPGSRVRVQGFCQSALVPGGQRVAAVMTVPGMKQVQLMEADPMQWSRYPLEPVGRAVSQNVSPAHETIVHVQGEAQIDPATGRLVLRDASGTIEVETVQPLPTNLTGTVEVIGRLGCLETNVLLRGGIYRQRESQPVATSKELPLLTTVLQIKQLSREQAQRRYPVKVRGVITLVRHGGSGFIIQDGFSAIDVWWPPYSNTSLPRVGDDWEVEGETSVEFSPMIESHRAVRLGGGVMPEPLHPARDQLLNGSLDTRYVEIQGVVMATESNTITLFTRDGETRLLLSPVPAQPLASYENALVRIRGCVVPLRDQNSQQMQMGQVRLSNMSLNVDEPAPSDLFGARRKHVSELLLFDVQSDSLHRVKIVGQIWHGHNRTLFVADGTNVIRVVSQDLVNFQAGDLVEAVGFPELAGGMPILREAVLRRTGTASLPEPLRISGDSLFNNGYDGRLISVEARLTGITGNLGEKVLELQVGNREFLARLENRAGNFEDLLPGSRLELTGVYSEQGVRLASGKAYTAFELLLNSPSAVQVLERPPWWTLRRALVFVGGMVVVVLAAVFWIVLLRRRVEERSAQLGVEMRLRDQFQRQNELEKERIRIAKDMHDQLGANVTKVGLLAELNKQNIGNPDKILANAEKIFQTASELGRGLDEIVWAVNPKNDSLDKFCDYMAVQAQELFQLTEVLCRVDLPPEMPDYPLCAEVRHNLFLAAKEALNNVVRHAHAREVWMRFKLGEGRFQISIVDDGIGFMPEQKQSLRNGLQNMKKRIEDVGGCFTVVSQSHHGTEVTFAIGLDRMMGKSNGGL